MPLIEKIEEKIAKINKHPEFSKSLQLQFQENARIEAIRQSLKIEKPNLQLYKQKRRKKNDCFLKLLKAREFLQQNGITLGTLAVLGNLIDPKDNPTPNFRNTEVQFGEFSPPIRRNEIIYGINYMIETINDTSLPLIKRAIDAHIETVKIHPYSDGNGRAARLIQNQILEENGYPIPLITETEREIYIGLMRFTLRDRYSRKSNIYEPSESEILLHDFLEGKILTLAKDLEQELYTQREYIVFLAKASKPNIGYLIAKELRGQGNCRGKKVSVSINKKNKNRNGLELKIKGDISYQELETKLKKYKEKKTFKCYKIERVTQ